MSGFFFKKNSTMESKLGDLGISGSLKASSKCPNSSNCLPRYYSAFKMRATTIMHGILKKQLCMKKT